MHCYYSINNMSPFLLLYPQGLPIIPSFSLISRTVLELLMDVILLFMFPKHNKLHIGIGTILHGYSNSLVKDSSVKMFWVLLIWMVILSISLLDGKVLLGIQGYFMMPCQRTSRFLMVNTFLLMLVSLSS
jgi:hypothetical protein